MTTFKEGDRVRITTGHRGKFTSWPSANSPGTVKATGAGDYVSVLFDGDETPKAMFSYELERIDSIVLAPETDNVKRPEHYQFGGVQVLDIVKHLPFPEGNVIKYVARADRKGKKVEDLRKAREYLDLAIEIAEAEDAGNP